jgi:hypothetical protein
MSQTRPISDSPWFWMLFYSGWTFIAFALLTIGKYGQRQSQLERQYQGRVQGAEKDNQGLIVASGPDANVPPSHAERPTERPTFSTPGNTIISLTPLTLIFFAVACFAAVMLWRERHKREANFGRPGSPAAGDAAP